MFTCPTSGVPASAFRLEDLLRSRQDLVDGGPGCVRRISVAPGLDRLYFRYLLRQQFFRSKYFIYFSISRVCYFCQSAPQIVDRISTRIEGVSLYFIFFGLIKLGLLALKIPGNQILGRSALIPRQKLTLAPQTFG
ncbi:hypothetical protein [Mycobacterium canetti]|uniref:Uncharacterized protein n=1 Tax=Mycobacterium canetti TaxID=78331 RepID=A0ABV1MF94_9MYCO|nr:hypothetical protein [Mycobacterium canetti]